MRDEIPPPLPILHEDDDIVAIAKPAWAVVHPTRGAEGAPVVLHLLREQLGCWLYPVHRLDRQTSGVLVLAKSSEMASRAAQSIRQQRWHKRYIALCRGPLEASLTVDHPVPEEKARRPARTEVEPLETLCRRYTLVRARPLTGRRHQLRYHFKHVRHPLVGDTNYGQGAINRFFRATFDLHRLFLHAERLRLPHPRQERELEIICTLSDDLVRVLEQLRTYRGAVA
jgi:tRNA pseudouridine65 synthase